MTQNHGMAPSFSRKATDEALSPLSPRDFRTYNRMADVMQRFHDHFRLTWRQLENATSNTSESRGIIETLSPKQLIKTGQAFCSQLNTHHSIEEQYLFPLLAKKMPEFTGDLNLVEQHRNIHRGLEELDEYLQSCRFGETDLNRAEVKRIMDGFGKVLWEHLDDEVRALGAENMRRYWTLQEMEDFPI